MEGQGLRKKILDCGTGDVVDRGYRRISSIPDRESYCVRLNFLESASLAVIDS